jgi:hypothetical protein
VSLNGGTVLKAVLVSLLWMVRTGDDGPLEVVVTDVKDDEAENLKDKCVTGKDDHLKYSQKRRKGGHRRQNNGVKDGKRCMSKIPYTSRRGHSVHLSRHVRVTGIQLTSCGGLTSSIS